MDKKLIRKFISEAVRDAFGDEVIDGETLQKDLGLLKDYKKIGYKVINGAKTWKFEFKTDDNSYVSHAFFIQYPNDVYKIRLDVHWKVTSKDNTAGAGKDFVMSFGPYEGYSKMVEDVNRRLNNNPMIGTGLYDDNNDKMLDKEIVGLLKRLKNDIEEIRALNHPSLKTLEKIYEAIKDIPNSELMQFCDDSFKGWLLKQGVIYKLQALDKLPYYRSLKSDMHDHKKVNHNGGA